MFRHAVLGSLALVSAIGCGPVEDAEPADAVAEDVAVDGEEADDRGNAGDRGADDAPDGEAPADARGVVDRPDASTVADRPDARADAAIDVPRDRPLDAPRDASSDRADASTPDRPLSFDGGCPPEMALVQGRVCVDRWEAHLEARDMDGGVSRWSPYLNPGTRWVRALAAEGEVPQGYISGSQARAACTNAGKRLCALADWLAGCRGPENLVYPYGNSYVRRRCNEARTPHPVVQFYGTSVGVFTSERMNNPGINQQPDTLAPSGAFAGCVSPYGLADMVGNLHEWINDTAGTFKGGFYVDAEINGRGCLYTTTAHSFDYRDYSTGFRCCADPR